MINAEGPATEDSWGGQWNLNIFLNPSTESKLGEQLFLDS